MGVKVIPRHFCKTRIQSFCQLGLKVPKSHRRSFSPSKTDKNGVQMNIRGFYVGTVRKVSRKNPYKSLQKMASQKKEVILQNTLY